jgi:hypothetical protein
MGNATNDVGDNSDSGEMKGAAQGLALPPRDCRNWLVIG